MEEVGREGKAHCILIYLQLENKSIHMFINNRCEDYCTRKPTMQAKRQGIGNAMVGRREGEKEWVGGRAWEGV